MFNLVEIDKLESSPQFVMHEPYIFLTTITNRNIASYWTDTFLASGDFNDTTKQINSVIFSLTKELSQQDSYKDMEGQEDSFYYDYNNQILYLNVGQENANPAEDVSIGVMQGYSTDTVRYFNDQEYIPIVTSIPTISEQADPLQHGIIAFASGSVELANPVINGTHLFNAKEKLRGNNIRILRGDDGDLYSELIQAFSGYIANVETTTSTETISLGDNREKLEIDYPVEVFDVDVDDTNDKLIPDGYGDVIQAPAYPTAINTGSVVFRWATIATSITNVYVEQDDKISTVTPLHSTTTPLASGYFYLNDSDAYIDGDNTKGLRNVYVTGRMRDYNNPADIIADLNRVVLGVEYNTTNYDTTEWESEKTSLADIALYMDDTKSLYEWIELIQNGSNIGFRYEDTDRRTIRLDNKDRTAITFDDGSTTIEPIDIRNSDIPIDQNAELYASSVIVKYGKNLRTDTYKQVTNSDYRDDVIQEFRVAKIDTYESLLVNESDAISKASLIAEDESTIRPILEITLESDKYKKPRIYDIINGTASLLTQGIYQDEFTFVLSDGFILGDDFLLGELYGLTRSEETGLIDYYGAFKGQVLGITPNTENDTVTIKLRDIGA